MIFLKKFLNNLIKSKKKEDNFKFSRGNKVVIIKRESDGLKGKKGVINKFKSVNGINVYYIDNIIYPNHFYLPPNRPPKWFEESELDFENKDEEREYKLNKILNG